MNNLIHRTPSIGGIIKKVMAINPELTVQDMIDLIKQSVLAQGAVANEFSTAQVIDEAKVLKLAQATTQNKIKQAVSI